jgi:hypothetical protein
MSSKATGFSLQNSQNEQKNNANQQEADAKLARQRYSEAMAAISQHRDVTTQEKHGKEIKKRTRRIKASL